jgi:hypothetical protein
MRTWTLAVVVFVAGILAINCGSVEPTSTSPSSLPVGSSPSRSNNPGTAPAPGTGTGAVQVTVSQNPVPFSGQSFPDLPSCATRSNTWFYDQVLKETGGIAVTVTRRVDTFDGAATAPTNPNLRIAANGTTSIRTRWCSVSAAAHTAQSTFSGTDANGRAWRVTGPLVRLSARYLSAR